MKENERELWYELRKAIIDSESPQNIKALCEGRDLTDFILDNSDICLNLIENDKGIELKYTYSMYAFLQYVNIERGDVSNQLMVTLYTILKNTKKDVKGFNYIINMIQSISMNKNFTIDPLLKTMILLVFKKKKILNFKRILDNFTENGTIHEEFVNKFVNDIDFDKLASNGDVALDIIAKYEPRIPFWGVVALRDDLTLDFVVKLQRKLPLNLLMYNKIRIKDLEFINNLILAKCNNSIYDELWTAYWKCCDVIISSKDGNVERILQNASVLCVLDGGFCAWADIHETTVLNEDFILNYMEKLNISEILKYYPLSDHTKLTLENYMKNKSTL